MTIPEVKNGQWYFCQLFVNGQRRQRARSPNTGYYRVAERLPGPPDAQGQPFARDKFVFAPGDLAPFERIRDVNLVLMHSWETSIHPLQSVDVDARTVQFAEPLKEWWCIGYWEPQQRYYVENAREMLDQPGEWYLNRETGVLSYWPLPGETLAAAEIVAPRATELVRFAGRPDEGRCVEHVTLRGLTLHHSDWVPDPRSNSSTQAAVEVPAAVMADGARHCTIEDCEVAHVGNYGLWLRRGCTDCQVRRNRLFDLGAGGIRVGEANMAPTDAAESSRNQVDNNHIFDGGHVYAAGIGVWVAQSSYNRVSNNDIHDLDYTGISIGWNWDNAPNRTHHNVIERNHVHHLGRGVLSDAGIIYCLGVSPGSVIRNNVFHDMWPYSQPSFGWGIYLDATCGGYLVENNLVYNTMSGGLMYNNGGHEHVIQNNIFAMSANHALWPCMEKRPSTFRRNIVYLTQGDLLIPLGERSLDERLAGGEPLGEWNKNLYWHAQGPDRLRFYRRDFAQWQALGLDRDSLIADPKFVDPERRDFQLTADSPAFGFGLSTLEHPGGRTLRRSGVGCGGQPCSLRRCALAVPSTAVKTASDIMATLRHHTPHVAAAVLSLLLATGAIAPAEETLRVDCARQLGTIRPLHGVNGGPLVEGETIDLSSYWRELAIPITRLHDCEFPFPDLVDMHAVFPRSEANPRFAGSFRFGLTDRFLDAVVQTNSAVVYRLGESIEHCRQKQYVHPPADCDRWAQACVGIIRHYNDGWANGVHYGIRYWEIWNEPENRPAMWTGTDDDYYRLYAAAAKTIKAEFPHVSVGGPSVGATGELVQDRLQATPFLEGFVRMCRERQAPLDFFSWHTYTNDPYLYVRKAQAVRAWLNERGFPATEIHLNEWNYLPDNDWTPMLTPAHGGSGPLV